jgi:hypothetical protein
LGENDGEGRGGEGREAEMDAWEVERERVRSAEIDAWETMIR